MSATTWRRSLVTGASSGIGREFARALAGRGCDLVAVARRKDRLEELADELGRAHGVQVEVLAADLTDRDDLAGVEARILDEGRPVDLVVNNAGLGSYGPFQKIDQAQVDALVELNVLALTRLSHAAVRAMLPRGRGGIVNVSSVASFQPLPYNTVYAATKAYVTSFSEALHEEVRGRGVRVVALCPGFVHTEFHDAAEIDRSGVPQALWLEAPGVARSALVALDRGRALAIPGAAYKVIATATRLIPRGALRRLAGAAIQRA